ncbi:MAG: response regulator [Acaryochloridaceae cyanobacterium RL_2_7]|nr:response regulator [Acaryochloridaceae cyanobacterium RL_2_7]
MQSAIVCVDDEFEILKSIGEQLKRRFGEHQIIELALSGTDAIALCQELTEDNIDIAVIISDQNMVGMGGDELLIRLHRTYPDALKIMLTGEANAEAVGNIVNHSALYRFISKPWNKTDLLMTVAEALRRFEQEATIKRQQTLLKATNTKLENSMSLLLATLDATADAILVLGKTGKVMIYNQQFRDLWNIELDRLEPIHQDILKVIAEKAEKSYSSIRQN